MCGPCGACWRGAAPDMAASSPNRTKKSAAKAKTRLYDGKTRLVTRVLLKMARFAAMTERKDSKPWETGYVCKLTIGGIQILLCLQHLGFVKQENLWCR